MYIRVYVCIGDVMKMKCVLSKDGVLACCLNLGFPLLNLLAFCCLFNTMHREFAARDVYYHIMNLAKPKPEWNFFPKRLRLTSY